MLKTDRINLTSSKEEVIFPHYSSHLIILPQQLALEQTNIIRFLAGQLP